MSEPYCENCGSKDSLAYYTALKPPYENLCVCEKCSYLPIREIERRKFPENDEPKKPDGPLL